MRLIFQVEGNLPNPRPVSLPFHESLFLTPFKQSLCEKAAQPRPEIPAIFQKGHMGEERNLLCLSAEGRAWKLCR